MSHSSPLNRPAPLTYVEPKKGAETNNISASGKFAETVAEDISTKIALDANNSHRVREGVTKGSKIFLSRMNAIGPSLYEGLGTTWEADLSSAFADHRGMERTMQKIADKLNREAPDPERKGGPSHPYFAKYSESVKGLGSLSTYHLSHAIYKDMETITAALQTPGITAEQTSVLQRLHAALESYAANDPARTVKEGVRNAHKNSMTTIGFNKMGQIAGILAFGTAAVFTGGIALLKKTPSAAPLLYGGVAALLAFPDLYKSFFDGEQYAALKQFQDKVNPSAFKKAAQKIPGEGGRALTAKLMDGEQKNRVMIEAIASGKATAEQKDAYTKDVVPRENQQEYAKIRTFLDDSESFAALTSVGDMTNKMAQEGVLDFIGLGAATFYRDGKEDAADMQTQIERQA